MEFVSPYDKTRLLVVSREHPNVCLPTELTLVEAATLRSMGRTPPLTLVDYTEKLIINRVTVDRRNRIVYMDCGNTLHWIQLTEDLKAVSAQRFSLELPGYIRSVSVDQDTSDVLLTLHTRRAAILRQGDLIELPYTEVGLGVVCAGYMALQTPSKLILLSTETNYECFLDVSVLDMLPEPTTRRLIVLTKEKILDVHLPSLEHVEMPVQCGKYRRLLGLGSSFLLLGTLDEISVLEQGELTVLEDVPLDAVLVPGTRKLLVLEEDPLPADWKSKAGWWLEYKPPTIRQVRF
jgi:hypothetical protein